MFHFCWLVYPSGELPNTVFLHIFSCEPHEHPFQSAPWCCVMCPNSRNSLWAPSNSAKAFLSGLLGLISSVCQHCLLLGLKGSSGRFSGASGHHHRTLLRAGEKVFQEGRSWGEVSADRSIFPSRLIIKLYAENMGDLGSEYSPHYRKRLTHKAPL